MNNNRGFTFVELIISMVVILIVSLGFFSWSSTIIQINLGAEQNNFAYSFANDVADKLQRAPDNALNRHNAVRRCVGFSNTGDLRECSSSGSCSGGTVSSSANSLFDNPSAPDPAGMTKYTNPRPGTALYLYENNNCQGLSWVDAGCGTNVVITSSANQNIDHPNATGAAYNSINPVRSYRNTTFYAVWSVAYMPCNAGATNSDKRKIFVTVYWIDPEPADTNIADVQTKLGNGTYRMKTVSVVADKSIQAE